MPHHIHFGFVLVALLFCFLALFLLLQIKKREEEHKRDHYSIPDQERKGS